MTEIYEKTKKPDSWALKPITAGRLKGKTDINPQWRYEMLDKCFGLCGLGWKYELSDYRVEPGANGEAILFVSINLYIRQDDKWSDAIPGFGGSMLIEREKSGMHNNDEAFKMAVTDALSVACKMLGIGADIYAGRMDGDKYQKPAPQEETPVPQQQTPPPAPAPKKTLEERIAAFRKYLETASLEGMNGDAYKKTFKELCLLAGPEKSEELTKLHNNRFQFLMQQPLEKE